MALVSTQIDIKKSIIPPNVKTLAAIDSGITLFKCLYLRKDNPIKIVDDEEYYQFVLKSWENKDTEKALDDILENGVLPNEGILAITGTSGDRDKNLIEKKFSLKCQFQDELKCHCTALHYFIKNMQESEYSYKHTKTSNVDEISKAPDYSEEMLEQLAQRFHIKEKFPIILVIVGSTLIILKLNEDGSHEPLSVSMNCGTSFLGLSKLLIGTRNFDEIIELAEKGNRSNVDLTFQDISNLTDDCPYGNIPAEFPLPIMPFGKAFQKDMNLSEFKTEDIAASLVSYTASVVMVTSTAAAKAVGTRNVFIGGSITNSRKFREEIIYANGLEGYGVQVLDIRYLKYSQTSAIGAMLSVDPDFAGYLHV